MTTGVIRILIVLLLTIPHRSGSQCTGMISTDNGLLTRIDSLVHDQFRRVIAESCTFGISLGIYIDGDKYFYNYGSVEKGKERLPTQNTIFEIGSITKTFTGILLAQAVNEDTINLDEDIRDYLSEDYSNLAIDGNPITILNLANHTSGLPEDIIPEELKSLQNPSMFDIVSFFEGDSMGIFLNGLKQVEIKNKPNESISYSNAGMITLGIILESVYKESYSALLERYITGPLSMTSTKTVSYMTDTINYTRGYDKKGNIMPHITFQIAGAAGGMISTAGDMVKYVEANIKKSNKAIALSHKKTAGTNDEGFGIGWKLKINSNQEVMVWHDGGEPGFSSYFAIIPEKRIGAVALASQRGRQSDLERAVLNILTSLTKS